MIRPSNSMKGSTPTMTEQTPPPPMYSPNPTGTPNASLPPSNANLPPPNANFQPNQQAPIALQPPPGSYTESRPKTTQEIGEEYRSALYAQCAQGRHQSKTSYGVCGIITGVLLFPFGLICLFMDTEHKCERCGVRLD